MDKFIINSNSNLKDYIEFNKHTILRKNQGNIIIGAFIFLGLVIGAIGLIFDEVMYVFFAIGAVAIIAGLLFKPLINHKIKSMYVKNPTVWLDGEITFTEEKIVESNRMSTSEIYWQDLILLSETENLILLYISNVQAVVVQKRLLTDEQISLIKEWYEKW